MTETSSTSKIAGAVARKLWSVVNECTAQDEQTGERNNDLFCGLFIYAGVYDEPPSEADAIVQAMQTVEGTWIAFADDDQSSHCADCAPPFVDCEYTATADSAAEEDNEASVGASFCHLRFPLTARGTQDVVCFMIDQYVPAVAARDNQENTAFICAYSRANILNDQQGDQKAHVISRFVFGGNDAPDDGSRNQRQQTREQHSRARHSSVLASAEEDGAEQSKKSNARKIYRKVWIVALGVALLGAIIAIVTLFLLRRKKQQSQQKEKQASLIAQALQQSPAALQQQMTDPVVVRMSPEIAQSATPATTSNA